MLKYVIYVTIVFCCFLHAKAQTNLVPNPSFEINSACPNNEGQIYDAANWYTPTYGTPDYFDTCCTIPNNVGVPKNVFGYQNAEDGAGYFGIIAHDSSNSYTEYISVHLNTTLIINTKYFVTFYISLCDSSGIAIDQMGCLFSTQAIKRLDYLPFNLTPQVANPNFNYLSNKQNWTKISGSFIADSVYKYLTIGDLKDSAQTHFIKLPYGQPGMHYAYYYIDNICVSTDSLACNTTIGIKTITNNQALFYYNSYDKKIVVKENGVYTLQLMDAYGNKINNLKLQGNQSIDVQDLPSGCYVLIFSNQQGNFCKKIIISP